MNKVTAERPLAQRFRHLPLAVTCLTILVFATTICLGTRHLRHKLRDQIKERDGEVLHAVAQMLEAEAAAELGSDAVAEDPASQLLVIFKASRLKEVMAIRLFDAEGKYYVASPPSVTEGKLDPADFARLKNLDTISRYSPAVRLRDIFLLLPEDPQTAPILDVIIPLHAKSPSPLLGVAQFIIDGQSIRDRFATIDRDLLWNALGVFFGGSIIILAILNWAFQRLQRTNSLLAERTTHLQRANQELVLAAKSSAVGAVTAHLVHGLKNPLSGLQNFVASRAQEQSNGTDPDWESAYHSTRRMHTLINEVVGILRDAQEINSYEVSLAELVEVIEDKTAAQVRTVGVNFTTELQTTGTLSSRVANLVLLILVNLIQNAVQATPKGKAVRLILASVDGNIVCEIRDNGPGVPAHLRESLFTPCQSAKEGGSGIGLAISKQLANHLEAGLELKSSASTGCVFALTLPGKLLLSDAALASNAARD